MRERDYGASDRTDSIKQSLDLLEKGFESITTSEQFRAYLETLSRFHDYSPNNVLLIKLQRPDATWVAGYKTWQLLGRQVRKRPDNVPEGKWGIKIIGSCRF
jgi:hypothetical protein